MLALGLAEHEFMAEVFTKNFAADRQCGRGETDDAAAEIESPAADEPGGIAENAGRESGQRPQRRLRDRPADFQLSAAIKKECANKLERGQHGERKDRLDKADAQLLRREEVRLWQPLHHGQS